jgi:PBP1b-binding outer membrane lipoprotein LpoB
MKGDYIMKKVSILLSLLFIVALFASCSTENIDTDSTDSSQTQNDLPSTSEDTMEENISDLPSHLYQITEMQSALSLRYDFEISEPTSLEINVSTISGKLSIGVKNRDTDAYVLELTECTKEDFNQVVSLEDTGKYSIVLKASNHTGSYEVIGTPITKENTSSIAKRSGVTA